MDSKICVKRPPSKRLRNGFQDQLSLNAGQKYCRMLQREHSAILLTFIKLPFDIKTFVLSVFEWPFYTGFTVLSFWSVTIHLQMRALVKDFRIIPEFRILRLTIHIESQPQNAE